jgi:alkanesulfonate monooxygenase SsuD/methylene tetrahydromethanopterin reductase-like flavin-dependent oxidoreductase (luciferase family)
MIAFHMFCGPSREDAIALSRDRVNAYIRSMISAGSDWGAGTTSIDYPNHPKMLEQLKKTNFDTQLAAGACWVGSPKDIVEMIRYYDDATGGFESASLQVNFNTTTAAEAEASMRLFASEVMPAVTETGAMA